MKSIRLKSVVLVVAAFLVNGAFSSLGAQEDPGKAATAEDPILVESRELFETIEEKKQEYERIEGEAAAASGEDKKALEKRASELAVDFVDDVQKLAANVVAREEKSLDASADRDRVTEMLQRVSRFIRDAIGRLDAERASWGRGTKLRRQRKRSRSRTSLSRSMCGSTGPLRFSLNTSNPWILSVSIPGLNKSSSTPF